LTTIVSLAVGIPAAYAMVRGRFRFKEAVTLLILSPLIIPPVLIAASLFLLLSSIGLIGSTSGIVLGHSLLALPFVTVIVTASLRNLDPAYELAALSLGASPFRVFRHIVAPLVRPAILTAALFAFLTSFGEFIVTLFVISTTDITLPIQLWKGIRFEFNPTIAAAAAMLTALTVAILLLAELSRLRAPRTRA
jgi:ABC-type spermidine/putrescine transport system permease subunit II